MEAEGFKMTCMQTLTGAPKTSTHQRERHLLIAEQCWMHRRKIRPLHLTVPSSPSSPPRTRLRSLCRPPERPVLHGREPDTERDVRYEV